MVLLRALLSKPWRLRHACDYLFMLGLIGRMFLGILFLILLINMDHKLSHICIYIHIYIIYIYISWQSSTKLFHSPDVRHLTIGALLCGRSPGVHCWNSLATSLWFRANKTSNSFVCGFSCIGKLYPMAKWLVSDVHPNSQHVHGWSLVCTGEPCA